MYKRFFGLRERPFDLTPNPRLLVLTAGHSEAISNIEYAIATRKGITLLVGQAGTGKTTVIRSAIERQSSLVHCVHLNNPALTRAEFVEMLAARFSLSLRAQESKTALLLELEELLRLRHAAGEITVLIVDEAQGLPLTLLEEIRLLANIETNEQKLLSVVLAGQPGLTARVDDPSMSQLKQRVSLSCELRALTVKETAGYVLSRIRSAGGVASDLFTIEAVMAIHEAAGGIPRTINVIADNALIAGCALQQRPVTRRIVDDVCRDLRVGGQSAKSAAHVRVDAPLPSPASGGIEGRTQATAPSVIAPSKPTPSAEPAVSHEAEDQRGYAKSV